MIDVSCVLIRACHLTTMRSGLVLRFIARSLYTNRSALSYTRPITRSLLRAQSTLSAEQTDDGYAGKDQETNDVADADNSPIEKYKHLIKTGTLNPDSHQLRIISKLDDLHDELSTYNPSALPALDKRISASNMELPWVGFCAFGVVADEL